jgi:hypothetical protein
MRCYALSSDRAAALRQYAECEALMQNEGNSQMRHFSNTVASLLCSRYSPSMYICAHFDQGRDAVIAFSPA